jgi:predicted TIM-barrel fold metal-dependent hydrolase
MTFGRTRERPLDHPDNEPLLAVANELRVPLFLHPQIPPRAVRDALYSGLPARFDFAVGTAALGWHYEAGVAFLRLVLSGAFDRHPDLRIVAGHWGDLLPFYLDEVDIAPRLAGAEMRPISEYYRRHLYVAPSGTLSARYVDWAIDVLGVDHLLFALDYPFAPRAPGDVAAFLRHPSLDGVAREQVAGANWEGLVAAIVR